MMAPLLMLIVWWVVSRSLAPLARMRRQVAEREADDLSPVSETGLSSEIRPLVRGLNLLFGRVGQSFHAQQHFVAGHHRNDEGDAAGRGVSHFAAVRPSPAGPQTVKTLSARVVTTVRRRRCESDHLDYAQVMLIPFAFSHGLGR